MDLVYSNKKMYIWLFKDKDKYYADYIDDYFCEYALELNSVEIKMISSDYNKIIELVKIYIRDSTSIKDRFIDVKPFRQWWDSKIN